MNVIYLACYVASQIRIPDRWVYLLLTLALVAAMSTFALAGGSDAEASSQSFSQEDVVPYGFESFSEANGSIDPYAPFYGEGDMIEQTVVFFGKDAYGAGASSACFLGISCRPW